MTAQAIPRGSLAALRQAGREARESTPVRLHAQVHPTERDAVSMLDALSGTRVRELAGVRFGRMLESPFAFFRGSAALMAYDLDAQPVTGGQVVGIGDANVTNVGLYASPERGLVADFVDFTQATNMPWEWDVKRLATSVVLVARDTGIDAAGTSALVEEAVTTYARELSALLDVPILDRFDDVVDAEALRRWVRPRGDGRRGTPPRRISERVLGRIAVEDDGDTTRIVDEPPLLFHRSYATTDRVRPVVRAARATVPPDVSLLLKQHEIVDVAVRVVGVGGVGTRSLLALLQDPAGEPLFLQLTEVTEPVAVSHGSVAPRKRLGIPRADPAPRLVAAQRILQAVRDPFAGWGRDPDQTAFLVRRYRPVAGSVALGDLSRDGLAAYVALCGRLLARAHAQSPSAPFVAGYVGRSSAFAEAVAAWAARYADVVERDYAALQAAAKEGLVPVERGV